MIQAIRSLVTFDEFIAWYPEHSEHRYELHDGVIVEMPKPIGKHSQVAGRNVLSLLTHSAISAETAIASSETILN